MQAGLGAPSWKLGLPGGPEERGGGLCPGRVLRLSPAAASSSSLPGPKARAGVGGLLASECGGGIVGHQGRWIMLGWKLPPPEFGTQSDMYIAQPTAWFL